MILFTIPNWAYWLVGLFFTSGAVLIYQNLQKRGKTFIQEKSAELFFNHFNAGNDITLFKLHFQFINKSGYMRLLTFSNPRFYDGENYWTLYIVDHQLPPAESIEPNKPKRISYDLKTFDKVNFPILTINSTAFVEIYVTIKDTKELVVFENFTLQENDYYEISVW